MARRYEDDPTERDDEWEEQRRRNERRLRSERDWFDPNQYEATSRYGSSARYDENRGIYGQRRGYYSEQIAGRPSYGEGGWARNRPEESRWIEMRQSYDPQRTSPYTPVAPQGGHSGKGPRGYVRSDERIREDVSDRLSWDDQVDASDITVTVSEGEVTLEGSVPDRMSKRRSEDIAEQVMGVKDVHNRLKANKGLMKEVGDKIMGREAEPHGHAGSGTRNQPASSSASNTQQNHR